jgi:predicted nucleotidyltransferase
MIKTKEEYINNTALNTAKQIITEEIQMAGYKVEAIYLFGSRARGDYKKDVEKYLKAYLAYNNKEIIKTHDISNILEDYKQIDTDFAKISEIKADKLT